MCGIAGAVSFSRNPVNGHVAAMTTRLRHRGPDGEGFVFFRDDIVLAAAGDDTAPTLLNSSLPNAPAMHVDKVTDSFQVGLGNRRLKILDLHDTGHQPMCDSERRFWITYNGEIYNYKELRDELKHKHKFISESDTEVVLYAYKEWGAECLKRFNGMWAFVIYDTREKKIFGARDRFGVKPFYYYHSKDYFAFASELKALTLLSFIKKEINDAAVFDFFVLGKMEAEEEGFFKNIFELFPSTYFVLDVATGQLTKTKYYSLGFSSVFSSYDEIALEKYSGEVRGKLIESVSYRMRSDVPVGVCLSGGIDSSAITGIIHHLLREHVSLNIGDRLQTFTASFKEKDFDESDYAKAVVQQTGALWERVFPDEQQLMKNLDDLVYSQDMPLWSTSTFAQHSVMRLVNENGIKVVLDGQGGDELFAGYRNYYPYFWNELLSNNQYAAFFKEINSSGGNISLFAKTYVKNKIIEKLPLNFRSSFYRMYNEKLAFLNSDFFRAHMHRMQAEQEEHSLNEALYNDFLVKRLKIFLKCEDRCSMWHSVESRVPFTDDHNMVEYVFTIPSVYKIRNGMSKYLLREAMKDLIPQKVYERKDKMGFNTPHNMWLSKIKDAIRPLFNQKLSNYLDVKKIDRDYGRLFSFDNNGDDKMVFRYITFAKWMEVFGL